MYIIIMLVVENASSGNIMILILNGSDINELLSDINISNNEFCELISYRIYRQYCIDSGVYSIRSECIAAYCRLSNSHEFHILDAVIRYAMVNSLYACEVKTHNSDIYITLMKEGIAHVAWSCD